MKNIYAFVCLWLCFTTTAMAQVPKLSSYPAAKAVIFLDFDGHTVEGTSWNSDGPIYCNGANLNAAQVTEIFGRIAEDYRPFNINITTDSTLYLAAPARQRTRLILTTSSSWYGSAGGVAFTNSFSWGDNTPCFVFTALLNYNVKFISEAASHEAGHTLGLNHQSAYDMVCNKTAEYNAGVGGGETGWAPIMGVGYYRNQTLWHYGSNPWGCNYMQDDLGMITRSANGLSFRDDDFGNTKDSATTIAFANNRFSVAGVIERPNDVDVVTFTLPARSRFKLSALPFSIGPGENGANLDVAVGLIANNDTAEARYNPASLLSASIDTTLAAGTYSLLVRGTGNENAPNFASLGSYTLDATVVAGTLPVHKLELKAVAENNRHKLDWEIVADEHVVTQAMETAADGFNFRPLANVPAAARTYNSAATGATAYYRLRVAFDNGREYYSNIASVRSSASGIPHLNTNIVSTSASVTSPASCRYTLVDMNGRTVARGQVSQGTSSINTSTLPRGLYVLQFTIGQEQYTEKLMKQ